jgi:tetratricopeptide (TPR) repeat protein
MPQIYIFLASLVAMIAIVSIRGILYNRAKQVEFDQEVALKVKELQKERQKEASEERFREAYLKEQQKKKFDVTQFKVVFRKAEMAIAKKQWNEAKRLLITSMTLTREDLPVSMTLASVYMESGDLRRAEELFLKLSESQPTNATLFENLGKIYARRKMYKEAIAAYVKATELDNADDKKWVALGRLYHLLLRSSIAAECFRRAAELKPRESTYLFLLAESCRDADDYENALFAYERILTMEPYNEKAREGAQDVRIRLNEIEKAMSR